MKFLFITLIATSIILFRDSLSLYFFQDDFFILSISNVSNIGEVLKFFIPRQDVQFYRPFSHQLFFFIGQNLFGHDPFFYHFLVWGLFLLNIYLVFLFGKKFFAAYSVLLMTILYATSAVHYNSLFWLANFSYTLTTACFLGAFLVATSNRKIFKSSMLTTVLYLIGLLSNEFMIVFIPLFVLYLLLVERQSMRRAVILLVGPLILTMMYGFVRAFVFKPHVGEYAPQLTHQVVSSYRFFAMYMLNWPEAMKDNMLTYWTIRPVFFQSFMLQNIIWLLNSALIVVIIIFNINILKKIPRQVIFAVSWIIIALLPIVFIPSHIAPHHATIALLGFLIVLCSIIPPKSFILYPLLTIWILSSSMTVQFMNDTHWIMRRAKISRHWIEEIQKKYPTVSKGATITIPNDEKEVNVALDDGEAFRQIYKDPSLKIEFTAAP